MVNNAKLLQFKPAPSESLHRKRPSAAMVGNLKSKTELIHREHSLSRMGLPGPIMAAKDEKRSPN